MNFFKRRVVQAHARKLEIWKLDFFQILVEVDKRLNPMFGQRNPNLTEDHIKTLTSLRGWGDKIIERFVSAEIDCQVFEAGAEKMYGTTVADVSNKTAIIEMEIEDFRARVTKWTTEIDAELRENKISQRSPQQHQKELGDMHEVSQKVYDLLLRYGEIQEADKTETADKMLEFVKRFDADPHIIELAEYVSPETYAIGVLVQLGNPLTEAGERQKAKHLEAARQRGKPLELPDHLAAHFAKARNRVEP